MAEIENLSISISTNTANAVSGVGKLASALEKLRSIAHGSSSGARQTGEQIGRVGEAGQTAAQKIERLSRSAQGLGKVKLSGNVFQQMKQLQQVIGETQRRLEALRGIRMSDMSVSPVLTGQMVNTQRQIDSVTAKLEWMRQYQNDTRWVLSKFNNPAAEDAAHAKGYEAYKEWKNMVQNAQKDSAYAQKEIEKLNTELDRLNAKMGGLDARRTGEMERGFQRVQGEVGRTEQSLGGLNAQMAALKRQAVIGTLTAPFRALGQAAGWAAGKIEHFFKSIARITFYRAIRAVLKDIGQGFKDLYGYSKENGTQFARSMDMMVTSVMYLRNSIVAMVSPIVNALAPAFDYLVDRVVEALNWVNQLISALSGADTYTVARKVAVTWEDTFDSAGNSASNANDKIKELKRTILSFDEINKLNGQNASGSGSGSGSGSSPYTNGYQTMFETRKLENGFVGFGKAIENAMSDTLSRIGLIVSGAALAIGAILTFTGANVPMGLGLMVAGAAGLANIIAANWSNLDPKVKGTIAGIGLIVGGGLLALGAILAFSGANIPLGIGLMAAGAVTLGTTLMMNWNVIKEKLQGPVGAVTALVSTALLAVGAVLAFSGANIPLGIGLMVVGAAGLGTTIAANWEIIKEKLQGPIGAAVALISGALLVLGILALVGGMIPLGIGLILAGTAGLATTVVANWDNMKGFGETAIKKVKEGWETIKELAVKGVVSLVKNVKDWASDAWEMISNGAQTVKKTISTWVEKGKTWVADAWNAAKMKASEVVRTVQAAVKKADTWVATAWTAATMAAQNIMRTVQAAVKKADTWVATAWTAATMAAQNIMRTVQAAVKKSDTWVATAWTAATMTAQNITRTVQAAVKKAASFAEDIWEFISSAGVAVKEAVIEIGIKIAGMFWDGVTNIWDWIMNGGSPISQDPEMTVEVNATAGDGLKKTGFGGSSRWELYGGIADASTKVNGTAGTGLKLGSGRWDLNGGIGNTSAKVDLARNGWNNVAQWITQNKYNNDASSVNVNLNRDTNKWWSLSDWITRNKYNNDASSVNVNLSRDTNKWWSLSDWITKNKYNADSVFQAVDLAKDGWNTVSSYVSNNMGNTVYQSVRLNIDWDDYYTNLETGTRGNPYFYHAKGGVETPHGGWSFAQGGYINYYARGTNNAHGTMFVAGEAGPEIVGHIGGRTEILNRSQLASTMFAAVRSAMTGVEIAANFYNGDAPGMSEEDMRALMDLVKAGSEAVKGQNALLKEQNEYLREIKDKEMVTEVTTAGINRAQAKANRRAGIVVG